jgi:hypothetical protein
MLSAAQRLALPAWGGTRVAVETEQTQSHEKRLKTRRVPPSRVHAVLGNSFISSLPSFLFSLEYTMHKSDG